MEPNRHQIAKKTQGEKRQIYRFKFVNHTCNRSGRTGLGCEGGCCRCLRGSKGTARRRYRCETGARSARSIRLHRKPQRSQRTPARRWSCPILPNTQRSLAKPQKLTDACVDLCRMRQFGSILNLCGLLIMFFLQMTTWVRSGSICHRWGGSGQSSRSLLSSYPPPAPGSPDSLGPGDPWYTV